MRSPHFQLSSLSSIVIDRLVHRETRKQSGDVITHIWRWSASFYHAQIERDWHVLIDSLLSECVTATESPWVQLHSESRSCSLPECSLFPKLLLSNHALCFFHLGSFFSFSGPSCNSHRWTLGTWAALWEAEELCWRDLVWRLWNYMEQSWV